MRSAYFSSLNTLLKIILDTDRKTVRQTDIQIEKTENNNVDK